MISSGLTGRDAVLRMFGIHNKHLKGTCILFANYETDGFTNGESVVFLRDVKTCQLLMVRGVHSNTSTFSSKKGFRGIFKGQWNPKVIDPNLAMKIKPFSLNTRFIKIMKSLLKQQEIVAKFNEHLKEKNKPFSILRFITSIINRASFSLKHKD